MSVTSTSPLRAQPTGSVSVGGVTEYTTVHRVKTDSVSDGVVTVAAAIGEPGVTTYSYGGESNSAAVLKTVTPKREKDKNLWWLVTSTWGPLDDDDQQQTGRDNDGNPTDDPLAFAITLEVDTLWRQAEISEAVFLGAIEKNRDTDYFTVGKVYTPASSAGEILDPPRMEEYPVPVFRLTFNSPTIPTERIAQYVNAINEDAWNWTVPLIWEKIKADPQTAWCQSWTAGTSWINGVLVATNRVSIAIDPAGWADKIPDQGYRRLYTDYDKPPFMLPNGETTNEPPGLGTGVNHVEMTDVYGEPIRQPAALDGFGNPLPKGRETVYLWWQSTRKPLRKFNTMFSNIVNLE